MRASLAAGDLDGALVTANRRALAVSANPLWKVQERGNGVGCRGRVGAFRALGGFYRALTQV
jgi:hypothetical protein